MAKTFKSQSRPGQFQNLFPVGAAFEDTERLVRANEREKAERSNRRKVLAGRNRDNLNSLQASFGPAAEGRNLALSNERARRGQETEMRQARILEAQESANRNAEAQATQSIKARNDIVNLIKDVGGTAVDLYQTFDKLDLAKQTEALTNAKLTVGASTEDIVKVRSINLDLIDDGERDNEKFRWATEELGLTPSQVKAFIGARQDAFYAVKVNSLERDVKNFFPTLSANPENQEYFNESTQKEGGAAEYKAWLNKQIHDRFVVGAGVDPNSPLFTSILTGLQDGIAAEMARFNKAANAHATIQQKEVETQSLLFTMAQFPNNPQGAAAQIGRQISAAKNPPDAVKNKLEAFVRAATGADPAQLRNIQDTFNEWANSKYMGIQLDQGRFYKEFQEAREVIYQAQNRELQQEVLEDKQAQSEFNDKLKALVPGQTTAEEADALGFAAARVLKNPSQFLSSVERWKEMNIPTTSGQASFYSDLNNGIATKEKIDDGEYGSDPETIYKLNKKLSEHESGDKRWQRIVKQVESDLAIALGVNQTDKIKHSSYYRALEEAENILQDVKLDHLRESNGDLDGAYKAMNDAWISKYKPGTGAEAFKGLFRVGNRAENPNDVGFPAFKGLEGDPPSNGIPDYTYLHNKLKQNNITKQADVLNELTSTSELSEQLIPSSQLKAWLESPHTNVGVTFLLDDLHNLSGRSTSRRELAVQIAESRNMDIPPTQQELIQAEADVIVQEINDKLGFEAAKSYNNKTLARRGENTGIIITSARDASGEPGSDFVISNGERGARFNFPYPSRVVRIERNSNWETNLETNPDGPRGPGNFIELEVELPTGISDVRIAHLDDVANIQVGQELPAGAFVGTQGRTGSTTGAHMSLDWYKRGTTTPDWDAAEWFLNNYLRGNQ